MSVHPSLSSKSKGKRTRSVLKRSERLKEMQEKEKWKPGDPVFGLPKLKAVRWKLKKAKKAAEAEPGAEAGVAATGAGGAQAPEAGAAGKEKAKPAPGKKGASAKK